MNLRPGVTALVRVQDVNWCKPVRGYPGGEEELVVVVRDPVTFARWHLGEADWGDALRSGAIDVTGSSALARALPTWNRRIRPGQHRLPIRAAAP